MQGLWRGPVAAVRQFVRFSGSAALAGGRYGKNEAETVYDTSDLGANNAIPEGHTTRRPFMLGITSRAMINRNRIRLGLPPVINWKKFTSEAVRIREELVGLDDPRALQQIQREKRSKLGSAMMKEGQGRNARKPYSKYAQTSSQARPRAISHPVLELMTFPKYRDAARVARIVNPASRESVADSLKALGRSANAHPSKIQYVPKPPVVTIMGHVDHGKTTLLDLLRRSDVASGEAGGITQAVGAFRVPVPGRDIPITFIDTPGHAAFDAMRLASMNATDMVVLVVSLVEGVQQQTVEIIQQIKKANVPVVVAMNKADRVKDSLDEAVLSLGNEMAGHGILLDTHDGDVLCNSLSAKTGDGVGELLDNILLQAEVLELTTPSPCRAEALIIESQAQTRQVETRSPGPEFSSSSTVNAIVKCGSFAPGQQIISGEQFVTIKELLDEHGNSLKEATPGQPISIVGFGQNPPAPNSLMIEAGRRIKRDEWRTFWTDLQQAKANSETWTEDIQRDTELLFWKPRADLGDEALVKSQRRENTAQLRLILKGSTAGMAEGMEKALESIPKLDQVHLRVVRKGAGDVDSNDGQLYQQRPKETMILGVGVQDSSLDDYEYEPVLVDVIYHMLDAVKERMCDFYPEVVEDTPTATAEVKDTFSFSKEKVGNVGGSHCTFGQMNFQGLTKVMRNGEEVYRGERGCVKSLRHVKDEVQLVENGQDFGIILEDGFQFEKGDEIVQYTTATRRPTVEEIFGKED
eukprot:TRINITY_DN24780_c0_g1_i1.p1 TRINITY_DN24780_c0_g1~~TRINITY_DN24780_c0_g1_i1.p1  ORF type:complete len:751 (+),score=266.75 TRINITY_DN24780_c0_g1_i1:124-2376(+)